MRSRSHIHRRWLIAIYLSVILAPLALSAFFVGPARSVLDEIASGAGMLAFVLILIEFTLSGRIRWLSRTVAIDTMMQVHRLIGLTALAAALVHPFLYRAERNPAYPWDTTRELTVSNDFSVLWTGIVAWVLLPSLVLLAQTRGAPNYRYEAWRWLHGISAIAVTGLAFHHVLYAGRYAAHPVVAGYWIALGVVVLVAIIWLYVAIPLGQSRHPWRVAGVEKAAERIWKIEIAPKDGRGLEYRAGQFVWLNIGSNPFAHRENPFSIASAPASGPNLSFLIKELGDTTSTIGKVKTGSVAYVDGPHGALTIEGHHAEGVGLIAGGIGIAPLISVLRQMSLEGDTRPRKLVYADSTPRQIVEREELLRLSEKTGVEVVFVHGDAPQDLGGERGQIDAALLARHFAPNALRTWVFALCGPPPMLDAVEAALCSLGVAPARILSERFDYD